MKSTIRTGIFITFIAGVVLSCASTPRTAQKPQIEETAPVAVAEVKEPTPSELYAQKVSGIALSLVSSPKETSKNKNFAAPYIVKVSDSDGKAVESFEIALSYPSSRKNGDIVFETAEITTDASGTASFLPPAPDFAFNSEISFFPKYENEITDEAERAQIEQFSAQKTITAPFKVQTNQKSAGGVIALVDFNQNGKPITSNPVSSSNLLMTLMKLGFTRIGNIDLTNQVVMGDDAKIHARARAIDKASSFLVYGTVKIDASEKTDTGFSYTLSAEVKSMNLKNGEITFKTHKTVTVTDKNDWNALDKARKTLANEIANEIRYGI